MLKAAILPLLLKEAKSPDSMQVGTVARSSSGAPASFGVLWGPDSATGTYTTTTESTAFPGAVDAYTVTHVIGGVTSTYTQPAVTRDANGAITNRPPITVA